MVYVRYTYASSYGVTTIADCYIYICVAFTRLVFRGRTLLLFGIIMMYQIVYAVITFPLHVVPFLKFSTRHMESATR